MTTKPVSYSQPLLHKDDKSLFKVINEKFGNLNKRKSRAISQQEPLIEFYGSSNKSRCNQHLDQTNAFFNEELLKEIKHQGIKQTKCKVSKNIEREVKEINDILKGKTKLKNEKNFKKSQKIEDSPIREKLFHPSEFIYKTPEKQKYIGIVEEKRPEAIPILCRKQEKFSYKDTVRRFEERTYSDVDVSVQIDSSPPPYIPENMADVTIEVNENVILNVRDRYEEDRITGFSQNKKELLFHQLSEDNSNSGFALSQSKRESIDSKNFGFFSIGSKEFGFSQSRNEKLKINHNKENFELSQSLGENFEHPQNYGKTFGLPKTYEKNTQLSKDCRENFHQPQNCDENFGLPKNCRENLGLSKNYTENFELLQSCGKDFISSQKNRKYIYSSQNAGDKLILFQNRNENICFPSSFGFPQWNKENVEYSLSNKDYHGFSQNKIEAFPLPLNNKPNLVLPQKEKETFTLTQNKTVSFCLGNDFTLTKKTKRNGDKTFGYNETLEFETKDFNENFPKENFIHIGETSSQQQEPLNLQSHVKFSEKNDNAGKFVESSHFQFETGVSNFDTDVNILMPIIGGSNLGESVLAVNPEKVNFGPKTICFHPKKNYVEPKCPDTTDETTYFNFKCNLTNKISFGCQEKENFDVDNIQIPIDYSGNVYNLRESGNQLKNIRGNFENLIDNVNDNNFVSNNNFVANDGNFTVNFNGFTLNENTFDLNDKTFRGKESVKNENKLTLNENKFGLGETWLRENQNRPASIGGQESDKFSRDQNKLTLFEERDDDNFTLFKNKLASSEGQDDYRFVRFDNRFTLNEGHDDDKFIQYENSFRQDDNRLGQDDGNFRQNDRFGQNNYRYGQDDCKYGQEDIFWQDNNKTVKSENTLALYENRFGREKNRFGLYTNEFSRDSGVGQNANRFGKNDNKLGQHANKFLQNDDIFGQDDTRFGQDRRFVQNDSVFVSNDNTFI